jgi:hypothetical protein
MQDGAAISGEDAAAWLREHFAGDPDPQITFTWDANAVADQGAYERLLEILFSPKAGDKAA